MYKSPLESFTELFTEEHCVICNATGSALCQSCFGSIFNEPDYRCYMCNKLTKQGRVCKSCKSSSTLRHVWWLGNYEDPLKTLVLNLKYKRQRATARLLGGYLADTLPFIPSETMVIALPTASSRIRRRGYDQAVLIAQSFARRRHLKFQKALLRKDQKELIGKRRIDRIKLMADSFRINPKVDIKGKAVLLIDDVLTTGASLESAARILRQAGAAHVDGAVITRKLLN